MPNMNAIDWSPVTDVGQVRVGDVVSAEAGGLPIYHVVALSGDAAWLGDERRPNTVLMPLAGFRWRGQVGRA